MLLTDERHKHICPEREIWCPFGSRRFWPIPEDMTLQECYAVVLHFQKKGF